MNYFGKSDANTLVVQGSSRQFNATLDEGFIADAIAEDAENGQAEWLGEFRNDLSSFVEIDVVRRCVEDTVRERPFERRHEYGAFINSSGGQHDSMVLAIGHKEGHRSVLDLTREIRAPFSPADATAEFVATLRAYHITSVKGDRYGSNWVYEAFNSHGIRYLPSEKNRSEIYIELLPMLMSEQGCPARRHPAGHPAFSPGTACRARW